MEEYDADIEAELLALETQDSLQSQSVQEELATNKSLPGSMRKKMKRALKIEEEAEEETEQAAEIVNDYTHPLDIADIRGRIQTIMDLSSRPPIHQRFDINI